ncbi:hypothetical protein D9M70_431470 [compost metagenome]
MQVVLRLLDGVPHAGLGGEVDDLFEGVAGEQVEQPLLVGDIQALEAEAGASRQPVEARLLERHAVVVVEVVDADHLVAFRAQAQGRVEADETGGAGDQHFHGHSPRPMA